jgi:hypothetical protein
MIAINAGMVPSMLEPSLWERIPGKCEGYKLVCSRPHTLELGYRFTLLTFFEAAECLRDSNLMYMNVSSL